MRISEKRIRYLIREALNKPAAFNLKFNDTSLDLNTPPNTAGVLNFIQDYDQAISLDQKKKETKSFLTNNIYNAIKSAASDSIKLEILKKVESNQKLLANLQLNYDYYVHINGRLIDELDKKVRSLNAPTGVDISEEGLRLTSQYDPGAPYHQMNIYRQKNFKKRSEVRRTSNVPSSKVYYTIKPLVSSFAGKDFQNFLLEFKKAIINIAVQLCVLVGYEPWSGHNYLDQISFKIPNSFDDLLKYNDDIVIYTDNYKESQEVEKRINSTVVLLNANFNYIQILTSDERRASGRVAIGVDPTAPSKPQGTSDTDALATYIIFRVISDKTNFDSFDRWAKGSVNSLDLESVWTSFKIMFDPIYLNSANEWMNMNGVQRQDAYRQALSYNI